MIRSKTREEAQEDQPLNTSLSFHSLPCKVVDSPCPLHQSLNFLIWRELGNLNVDLPVRGAAYNLLALEV